MNTEASYTRPSFSAKTSKKLAGRYFFAEEPGRVYIFVEETVEKLDEPKREHVLYFLDGNGENWLVEFLDSLTRNSTSKTMCFARRVPRPCVRGFTIFLQRAHPAIK